MSTSNMLRFVVKREDTGKVIRIELEENKQIFDLLESSRVQLKFEENALLCVYREGDEDEKFISEAFYVREMADINVVLIIKDKSIEEKKKRKEERAIGNEENLANATKIKKSITEEMKIPENPSDGHDAFSKKFDNVGPTSSPSEHKLLGELKEQTKSNDTATTTKDATEDEEIRILTRKINSEGLDGFDYEIIPESCADNNESKYYERSFSSEEEQRATQSKVNSTTDWSSWNAEAGVSAWGVSVSTSVGQDTSNSESHGTKNQKTKKSRVAVVTKTSFHQMKKFRVKVKLGKEAIADVKEILNADMNERLKFIKEFNNKYCNRVYSGQFSAGGWFRTVATATSTEDMDFIALEKEAAHKTETHWSVGVSGGVGVYSASAGGGQNIGTNHQKSSHESEQNTTSTVQVKIRKESAPGNTSSENDLETKIKDPKNWTICPIVGANKSDFTPVYKIIENTAVATGDKDLEKASLMMKLYMKVSSKLILPSVPYICLVGDVGTGKSTIAEKLTGEKGRSSDSSVSYTRKSKVLWALDGSLIIADTPGSNAMDDELQHNIWIAGALNFMPVSRIFIVVKAETRMDNVVGDVRKYSDCFLELPLELVGVIVTHMDTVGWTEKDFTPRLKKKLGIDTTIFTSINTKSEKLLPDILQTCNNDPYPLSVDDENFFKLFVIHDNERTILQSTNAIVKDFRAKKKAFDNSRRAFSGKELVDLLFEFQAYMTQEIVEAQERMSNENSFTFDGDGAANEAAHVANMANQLRAVLYNVRIECAEYHQTQGVSQLRKCPHCDLVWTKVEACDGATDCGRRPQEMIKDYRDSSYSVMAKFCFKWDNGKLTVEINGKESANPPKLGNAPGVDCGKTILWSEIKPVDLPPEFNEIVAALTNDVKVLPPDAVNFGQNLKKRISAAQGELKFLSIN